MKQKRYHYPSRTVVTNTKTNMFHSCLHRKPVVGNNGYIQLLTRQLSNLLKSDGEITKKK